MSTAATTNGAGMDAGPRRPPCIVCGRRRGHDAETHDKYRQEYRRCKNLLRRSWPRLAGLPKLIEHYARQDKPAAPSTRTQWTCKVHPSGEVTHHPVEEETPT